MQGAPRTLAVCMQKPLLSGKNNSMHSKAAEKLCDLIPGVEHASFHGVW